jgi:hypothetical protein
MMLILLIAATAILGCTALPLTLRTKRTSKEQ